MQDFMIVVLIGVCAHYGLRSVKNYFRNWGRCCSCGDCKAAIK